MTVISKQYMVGQFQVGEEFATLVDGKQRRVRVLAVRPVVRSTDEATLEVLYG